jgi:hypothetical protein
MPLVLLLLAVAEQVTARARMFLAERGVSRSRAA